MADVIKTNYMNKANVGYSEYVAKDSVALSAIPPKPGDRALCIEDGKVYFCINNSEWCAFGETKPLPSNKTINSANKITVEQGMDVGVNHPPLNLGSGDVYTTTVVIDGEETEITLNASFTEDIAGFGAWSLLYMSENVTIGVVDKVSFNKDDHEFEVDDNSLVWIVDGLGDSYEFTLVKSN